MAVLKEKFTLATTNAKPSDKSTVKGHGVFGKGATLYIVFNKVWKLKKKKMAASPDSVYSTKDQFSEHIFYYMNFQVGKIFPGNLEVPLYLR